MFIDRCCITKGNAKVIKEYSDNVNDKTRLHSGLDIEASEIYSICPGVVTQRFNEGNLVCLTIQYNSNLIFRYRNLSYSDLYVCDMVRTGDNIGRCNNFIHFECISNDHDSIFPVEIFGDKYYKIDPLPYIDGSIQLYQGYGSEVNYI